MKIVVIGGVAAGPKAAARAKRCNPEAQVTLVEKGEWISYGGCGLPYYVGATVKELNDLMTTSWEAVRTPEFMKATKDIDTLLGWEATKINRAEKTVELVNVGTKEVRVLPYDKLVLATGADNFKPPIENVDAAGVFTMKTPKDAVDMQEYIKKEGVEQAVVIGAGLIGMETAEAYANWGVDVTVIEMKDWIFPQMLDEDMAAVFQNYLESEDMNFMLSTKVEAILVNEEGKVSGVKTDKGELEAQLVLVAAGVRPSVKLAVEAGLEVDRAIIVNEYCQTSDPDIYAGGDCVMCTISFPASGSMHQWAPPPTNTAASSATTSPAVRTNSQASSVPLSLRCSTGLPARSASAKKTLPVWVMMWRPASCLVQISPTSCLAKNSSCQAHR